MKRETVIFYFLLLSLCSCTPHHNEVYYSFEDVTIKKIDHGNRTTLYYLENGVPVDTVWTTYSGLTDSWYDVFLYFLPDKRILIEVNDGDKGWNRKRKKPNKFLFDDIDCPSYYVHDTEWNTVNPTREYLRMIDSLTNDGRCYRILLTSMEYERDIFNKNNPTRVKVSRSLPELDIK